MFRKFPALPRLTKLNIRNNSLTNLDVLELKRKCQNLSEIIMTGNNWSCDHYEGTLKTQLNESNINEELDDEYPNEAHCLQNPVPSEVKSCPRIDRNQSEGIKFASFWVSIILICVIIITELVLLRYFTQIFNFDFQV
jgi:hypothetical protein